MSGAALALTGQNTTGAGGGDVTPNPLNWGNIFDPLDGSGTNAALPLAGVTSSITIALTNSGAGDLYYTLDGTSQFYTGPFTWTLGQYLGFIVNTLSAVAVPGTVAVINNSDGAVTLDTFTYSVRYYPT